MSATRRKYLLLASGRNTEIIQAYVHENMNDAERAMEHAAQAVMQSGKDVRTARYNGYVRVEMKWNTRFWKIFAIDVPGWYLFHSDGHDCELYASYYDSKEAARDAMRMAYEKAVDGCTGWANICTYTACTCDGGHESSTTRAWFVMELKSAPDMPSGQDAAETDGCGTGPEPRYFLKLRFGKLEKKIYLDDLDRGGRLLDSLLSQGTPDSASIGAEQDGTEITASVEPKEKDYPHITVDGHNAQNGDYWLGEFELPCGEYPDRITSRLYAGCEKDETDEPIALVSHDVTKARKEPISPDYRKKKLIYVDYDAADTRTWKAPSQEDNPEHREDEA